MPLVTMTLTAHNAMKLNVLLTRFYKEEEVRKDNIVNMTFPSDTEWYICHLTYFAVTDPNLYHLHAKYTSDPDKGIEKEIDYEVHREERDVSE